MMIILRESEETFFPCNKHRSYREQSDEIITQQMLKQSRQRVNPVIQICTHVPLVKTFFLHRNYSQFNESLNEARNCTIKRYFWIPRFTSWILLLMQLVQRKRFRDEKISRRCFPTTWASSFDFATFHHMWKIGRKMRKRLKKSISPHNPSRFRIKFLSILFNCMKCLYFYSFQFKFQSSFMCFFDYETRN